MLVLLNRQFTAFDGDFYLTEQAPNRYRKAHMAVCTLFNRKPVIVVERQSGVTTSWAADVIPDGPFRFG